MLSFQFTLQLVFLPAAVARKKTHITTFYLAVLNQVHEFIKIASYKHIVIHFNGIADVVTQSVKKKQLVFGHGSA